MTNNEVNKVIAEYMGYDYINYDDLPEIQHISGSSIQDIEGGMLYRGNHFTLSLDALVPVWDRLSVEFSYIDGHFNIHRDNHENSVICNEFVYKKSIQEAAAHATAKAIMALGEQ